MKKTLMYLVVLITVSSCYNQKEDPHIDITYTGEELRFVACPLGGIGTGNLLLNGYGAIRDIEIFNRASMSELPPDMTFFSLYTRQKDQEPVTRVMEREFLDEYPNPFGKPRQQLGGLPRFREAVFHNAYPMARIDLLDEAVPLDVTMTAWSPYIPVDTKNSSLPAATIEWNLANPGKDPVEYTVAFCMSNPMKSVSADLKKSPEGCTVTPWIERGEKGVTFSSPAADSLRPDAGAFRVVFPSGSELSTPLYSGSWWDNAHLFWDDLTGDGKLEIRTDTIVQSGSRPETAAMYVSGTLAPGQSVTLPFLFMWHVPYRKQESNMAFDNDEVRGHVTRNFYSQDLRSIDEVTSYVYRNYDLLRKKTMEFSEAMITSTVAPAVLDAAISNMASLKTNLLMQNEAGHVHGYEGLGNDFGCCPGNCTHVWNYAQTMAALFPSLERDVRETGYLHSTFDNGYQCFRTVFPLSDNYFKNVAADGQMGNIMRVYREWKMSGDNTWLGSLWPDVKNALEFAWKGPGDLVEKFPWMNNCPVPWDPDKEGVLRGDQHNTYDINFFGPNMMTGSLYLGALKACSEMAMAMNEPQKSAEYSQLYEQGRKRYMNLLWNGEYFIQEVEVIDGVNIPGRLQSPPDEQGRVIPKYQYGEGCLSDQLLGQYLAFVSGLGYIMDTSVTKTALQSIFKYNFREQMRDFENVQRIYAANDESGLVICSWPDGNKPVLPFVYADEVWTGIEYQVATSLLYAGLVDEGLRITEGVRSRYSGDNRNPFAEIESGRYYARAMSSWGVYQAMAGYDYNAPKATMKFAPAIPVLPMRYFWSTASGWGTIEANRAKIQLTCLHGSLDLREISFVGYKFFSLKEFKPSREVDVKWIMGATKEEGTLQIRFPGNLHLDEGEDFSMDLP